MKNEFNEYYKRREEKNIELVECLCIVAIFALFVIAGFAIYAVVTT